MSHDTVQPPASTARRPAATVQRQPPTARQGIAQDREMTATLAKQTGLGDIRGTVVIWRAFR